jgi:pimeloyl-ACP methyl ester carboxylesterase
MPPYMRFGGVLPLHRIALSLNINRWMGRLENFNLAVETPEEEAMVERFRQTVDKDYLRWAIDVIVRWQNTETPPGVLHIHGDRDRIFPIRHIQPDHVVEGGGHFLIHNRSAVVNSLLQEDLSKIF